MLALVAALSWTGDGWGYFAVYSVVLLVFSVFVGVSWLVWTRRQGATREGADAFLERSLRSFARAQITLALAVLGAGFFARLTSGPLGPFPGGAFAGEPTDGPLDVALWKDGSEIALQIHGTPPYTITTHAFVVDGALYVGADFFFPFKRWVHVVGRYPEVLVRVDGALFRRNARRLTDPGESRRLLEEISKRRGHSADDWLTDVWFFRMDQPS